MLNKQLIVEKFEEVTHLFKEVGIDLTNHLFIYEEPSELVKELSKYLRGNDTKENIVEEGVDTIIAFSTYLTLFYNEHILETIVYPYEKEDCMSDDDIKQLMLHILNSLPSLMLAFPLTTLSINNQTPDTLPTANLFALADILQKLDCVWELAVVLGHKYEIDVQQIFEKKLDKNIIRLQNKLKGDN